MKKIFVMMLITVIIMSLASCSSTEGNVSSNEESTGNQKYEQTSSPSSSNENNDNNLTIEDLLSHPVANEADFFFNDDGNGGYILMEYNGNSPILNIPDDYNGKPISKNLKYLFANNSIVTGIKFSDSMIEVAESSCGLNQNLQVAYIGKNVKTIGIGAFQGCNSLHTVQLNEGLETISIMAFAQCQSLKSITIPSSVSSIDKNAFMGCPEDFVIYGVSGSVAETFANDNGIKFVAK